MNNSSKWWTGNSKPNLGVLDYSSGPNLLPCSFNGGSSFEEVQRNDDDVAYYLYRYPWVSACDVVFRDSNWDSYTDDASTTQSSANDALLPLAKTKEHGKKRKKLHNHNQFPLQPHKHSHQSHPERPSGQAMNITEVVARRTAITSVFASFTTAGHRIAASAGKWGKIYYLILLYAPGRLAPGKAWNVVPLYLLAPSELAAASGSKVIGTNGFELRFSLAKGEEVQESGGLTPMAQRGI